MSAAPPRPASRPAPPPRRGGARGGFLPAFAWGLARVVRWRKVVLVGLAAAALGVLLGQQARGSGDPARALAKILDRGVLIYGLPLLALLLASEGYAVEVQARTLVYHLVRPLHRTTLFLARFLAGWVPAALASGLLLGTLVVTSGVALPGAAGLTVPATAVLGSLALAAIYYTLGALFRNGFVAGLIYTFVVETLISSAPGAVQRFSVMHHVRGLHHALTEGVLPDVPLRRGRGIPLEDLARVAPGDLTATEAATTLLVVTALALAVGAWRTARRDFALKD